MIIFLSSIFGIMPSMRDYSKYIGITNNRKTILYDLRSIREREGRKLSFEMFKFMTADTEGRKRLGNLIVSFIDEQLFFNDIDSIISRAKNISQIVIVADGFGGNIALRYAEIRKDPRIKLICAWYPHLVFPPSAKKYLSPASIKEPNLDSIPSTTRIVIFHGDQDTLVEPSNLPMAREYSKNLPNVELVVYPGADHAFAQKFVQGYIPNLPYYWFHKANRKAHRESWARIEKELQLLAHKK